MLPGVVDAVEIAPLSADEIEDEAPLLSVAAGPIEVASMGSLVTNGCWSITTITGCAVVCQKAWRTMTTGIAPSGGAVC